jgi:hypothetical protein
VDTSFLAWFIVMSAEANVERPIGGLNWWQVIVGSAIGTAIGGIVAIIASLMSVEKASQHDREMEQERQRAVRHNRLHAFAAELQENLLQVRDSGRVLKVDHAWLPISESRLRDVIPLLRDEGHENAYEEAIKLINMILRYNTLAEYSNTKISRGGGHADSKLVALVAEVENQSQVALRKIESLLSESAITRN